jgi:hypothetical protein
VVSGDDIHGTADRAVFKEREGALGDRAGNALVIEDIAGDQDKMDLVLGGALAELLDRLEAGLSDAVARAFIKARDPQSKVQVGGVEEPDQREGSIEVY